jgi:hypothetical protein
VPQENRIGSYSKQDHEDNIAFNPAMLAIAYIIALNLENRPDGRA